MTYREWERYERERLASRNGVANDLRAENERLRGLLSELVYAHGDPEPMTTELTCYYCGVEMEDEYGDTLDYKHADDCAWWNAVQALGVGDDK